MSERRSKRYRMGGAVGDGSTPCAHPGCEEVGEFRAPARPGGQLSNSFGGAGSGEGRWLWLCLEHVREFNAGYNYFEGMDEDRIFAEQHPLSGWAQRTVWADGDSPPPRWQDFADPLDAIGARFARGAPRQAPDGSPLSDADARALKTLDLDEKADKVAIRRAYSAKLRAYHPDRNGGDRTHEDKLHKVVEAYQRLRRSPAFA